MKTRGYEAVRSKKEYRSASPKQVGWLGEGKVGQRERFVPGEQKRDYSKRHSKGREGTYLNQANEYFETSQSSYRPKQHFKHSDDRH